MPACQSAVWSYGHRNPQGLAYAVVGGTGRLYLATDSAAVTSGPSKQDPKGTACRGCILEFTYERSGPAAPAQAAPRRAGATKPRRGPARDAAPR